MKKVFCPKISVSYCDGCHVEIICEENKLYNTIIKDGEKELLNSTNNLISYTPFNFIYTNYEVFIYSDEKLIFHDKINLKSKKVKVNIESTALGDNIAWISQIDRFQKKHQCELYVNSFYKDIFENVYPNLIFKDAEKNCNSNNDFLGLSCKNFYCLIKPCNCYYASFEWYNAFLPEYRNQPISKIASDSLGMEYEEVVTDVWIKDKNRNIDKPYVCIAVQSTGQFKYWNHHNGWQIITDYLKSIGYDVVCIDKHNNFGYDNYINSSPNGVIDKTGDYPLQERITDLLHCDFFIGLSSGLSWLAWSLKKPVVMISGFSDPITEFNNPYRVHNKQVCNSCWNDINIEQSNFKKWSSCPRNKDFECSKEITPEMVIDKINLVIKDSVLTIN